MGGEAWACWHRGSGVEAAKFSFLRTGIAARLSSLAALSLMALVLLAVNAAVRPAAAQAFNFSCSTTSLACTGSNGDSGTGSSSSSGAVTVPLTGPTPGTITGTLNTSTGAFAGTFVGPPGTAQLSCTGSQTSANTVTGSCVAIVASSSSSSQGSSISTLKGAANAITRGQVEISTDILSDRIRSFSGAIARSLDTGGQQSKLDRGYYSGLSAGSSDFKWGVWIDSSGYDLGDSSIVAKFNGYGLGELVGVDYLATNKWLLGFNAGYVRTDVHIPAIAGHRLEDGEQLGPYVSYIASPHVSGDLLFNYSRLSNTSTGLAGFDSNRYSGAANVNFFYDVGGFALTGFMGYVYAIENPSSAAPGLIGGVPTSVHYGAVKVGGEAAYPIDKFEPYVPLTVEYETTNPKDGTGRGVVIVGAGLRYRFTDAIKGGISVTSDELRSNSTNIVGAANLRISF
jgi:hypothetical protein